MTTNVYVNNGAELQETYDVLSSGAGGTIYLTAEFAGQNVALLGSNNPSAHVTITSVDETMPILVSRIALKNVENLSILDISVGTLEPVESAPPTLFEVSNCSQITIQEVNYSGNAEGFLEDKARAAQSLGTIRDSEGVVFLGNVVSNLFQGLSLLRSSNINIQGNEFTLLQGDGVRMESVDQVSVQQNYFHDFFGSLNSINHDDFIQVWGVESGPSSNLNISDNIFISGGGAATETIFIRNEFFNKTGQRHENILIENNLVYNGHSAGITVNDTDMLQISNNTVLWDANAFMYKDILSAGSNSVPSIWAENSVNGFIEKNILAGTIKTSVDVLENVHLDYVDPTSDFYIQKHFINSLTSGNVDLRDFWLRPESSLNSGFGSSVSQLGFVPAWHFEHQTPVVAVGIYLDIDDPLRVSLDAFTFAANLQDQNALPLDVLWYLDGALVADTRHLVFEFSEPGIHKVRLEVSQQGEVLETIERTVEIKSRRLLELDFSQEFLDKSTYNSIVYGDQSFSKIDGEEVYFVSEGQNFRVARANTQLNGLSSFELSFDFALLDEAESGTLLRFHKVFTLSINDGIIRFDLTTDHGDFTLQSENPLYLDTDFHNVTIRYDGKANELSLSFDGTEQNSVFAEGRTSYSIRDDLVVGDTWEKSPSGYFDNLIIDKTSLSLVGPVGSDLIFVDMISHAQATDEPDDLFLLADNNGNNLPHSLSSFVSETVNALFGDHVSPQNQDIEGIQYVEDTNLFAI